MTEARTAMVLAAGLRRAHAPSDLAHAEAAGAARRPAVCSITCSTGSPPPASRPPSSTSTISPSSSKRISRAATGKPPETLVSDERGVLLDTGGGAKKALPLLGRGPFFIHNADLVWSEGATPALTRMLRKWNPATMDCLLLLAPTATSIGYAAKGDFSMAPDGRLARRGRRGRAVRLCRRVALR